MKSNNQFLGCLSSCCSLGRPCKACYFQRLKMKAGVKPSFDDLTLQELQDHITMLTQNDERRKGVSI